MAKICIDPGHGGHDPGAVGPRGVKEKNITLAVALKVAEKLRQAGVEVKLTRTSDVFIDLQSRCDIANAFKADYFVSIHCNSAANQSAKGTETYCYQLGGKGETLAKAIQTELIASTGRLNRGVKTASFYVLRNTAMTAVLTELAFISNLEEEKLLNSPEFQEKCATAIAKAVAQQLNIIFSNKETVSKVEQTKVLFEGKELEAFLKDGKTYVEVRKLCEALGLKVVWHSDKKLAEVKR